MEKKNIFAEILFLFLEFFSKKKPTPLPIPEEPKTEAAPPKVTEEKKEIQPTFILTRKSFRADGIFSELTDGKVTYQCLEHAYDFGAKIPNGLWKCVRGPHRLHGMTADFSTFEIEGIKGRDNLLFHWGNYNKDSEGCVLVGEKYAEANGVAMVTNSRAMFAKFMSSLEGVNEFYLLVK